MSEASQPACPSCGAVSPPDAQFCRECGAILVRSTLGSRPVPLAEEPSPSLSVSPAAPRASGGSRRRRMLALALAGGIALAVAVLLREQGRPSSDLPVPGAPIPEPTAAPLSEPTITRPQAAAPTAAAARDTETIAEPPPRSPSGEPDGKRESEAAKASDGAREPAAPSEPQAPPRTRRAASPRASADQPEVASRLLPGWYRVRFRAPLFGEPSETAPVVTYLPAGTRIRVTRVLPGFFAVESATGKPPGYVSSDDAAPEDRS